MLLNLSNHPSSNWSKLQYEAAIFHYDEVLDLPFPNIDPDWDDFEVETIVEEYLKKVINLKPDVVHIMGEMTFCFKLITRLKMEGVSCVASTASRNSSYVDGTKLSVFNFVRFRYY